MNKWDKWHPDEPSSNRELVQIYAVIMAPIGVCMFLLWMAQ